MGDELKDDVAPVRDKSPLSRFDLGNIPDRIKLSSLDDNPKKSKDAKESE